LRILTSGYNESGESALFAGVILKSIELNPRVNPKCSNFSSYHDSFFGFCFCADRLI
jgi:hypothetical protein